MIFKRKWSTGLLAVTAFISLTACAEEQTKPASPSNNTAEEMDHSTMSHSSSGEVPSTLKNADNPKFSVGSNVIITDGHMDGMRGAEATIIGAYNTTAYVISYEPTSGGKRVENHKWVIHEELIDPEEAPLAPGTEVKTDAAHMEGMENATVRIEEFIQTTVYLVDYTSTTNGEAVKNHKWVTEEELTSK